MLRRLCAILFCALPMAPAFSISGGDAVSAIPGTSAETFYKAFALVHVYEKGDSPSQLPVECGGVLIERQFVLTDGHCVANAASIKVYFFGGAPPQNGLVGRSAVDWVKHRNWSGKEAAHTDERYSFHDEALILIPSAPSWNKPLPVAFEYDAPVDHPNRPLYVISREVHDYYAGQAFSLREVTLRDHLRFPGRDSRLFGAEIDQPRNGPPNALCHGDSGSPVVVVNDGGEVLIVGLHNSSGGAQTIRRLGRDKIACGSYAGYYNVTYDTQSFIARAKSFLAQRNPSVVVLKSAEDAAPPTVPSSSADESGHPSNAITPAAALQDAAINEASAACHKLNGGQGDCNIPVKLQDRAGQQNLEPVRQTPVTDPVESGSSKPVEVVTSTPPSPETAAPSEPYEACSDADSNRESKECQLSLRLQAVDMVDKVSAAADAADGGDYQQYTAFYSANCKVEEGPKWQFTNDSQLQDGVTITAINGMTAAALWFDGRTVHQYNLLFPDKISSEEFSLVANLRLKGGKSPAIRVHSGMTMVLMPSNVLYDVDVRDDPLKPKMGLKKCGPIVNFKDFMRSYLNEKIDLPYFQQAARYLDGSQLPGALLNFQKAVDIAPTWRAYYWLAKTQYDMDKTVDAFRSVNAALQRAPSSAGAYELRGMINEKMQARDAAMADFRKAIELDADGSFKAAHHLEALLSPAPAH